MVNTERWERKLNWIDKENKQKRRKSLGIVANRNVWINMYSNKNKIMTKVRNKQLAMIILLIINRNVV